MRKVPTLEELEALYMLKEYFGDKHVKMTDSPDIEIEHNEKRIGIEVTRLIHEGVRLIEEEKYNNGFDKLKECGILQKTFYNTPEKQEEFKNDKGTIKSSILSGDADIVDIVIKQCLDCKAEKISKYQEKGFDEVWLCLDIDYHFLEEQAVECISKIAETKGFDNIVLMYHTIDRASYSQDDIRAGIQCIKNNYKFGEILNLHRQSFLYFKNSDKIWDLPDSKMITKRTELIDLYIRYINDNPIDTKQGLNSLNQALGHFNYDEHKMKQFISRMTLENVTEILEEIKEYIANKENTVIK